MSKRKHGGVYNFFKHDDETGRGFCLQEKCKNLISWKSHNLKRHLALKHPEVFEQLNAFEKAGPVQPSFNKFIKPAATILDNESFQFVNEMPSFVWNYFKRVSDTEARCEKCSKELSWRTGTKGLIYHLRSVHKIVDPASESQKKQQTMLNSKRALKNKNSIPFVGAPEQTLDSSPKNCFTCNSELGSCRIPLSCRTETTQTPLKELLESIGDISLSQKNKSEGVLCNQCYTVVERFDYLQDQSRKVQVRLAGMLKRAQPEEIYIKEEPDESIDDEYELSNADESDDDDDWTEMHRTSATKRRRTSAREIPDDEMKDETSEKDFNCEDEDNQDLLNIIEGCSKKSIGNRKRLRHLRVHSEEKPFECPDCPGKRFTQKYELDLHMKNLHQSKDDQSEACKICGVRIPSKAKMKLHLEKSHDVVFD